MRIIIVALLCFSLTGCAYSDDVLGGLIKRIDDLEGNFCDLKLDYYGQTYFNNIMSPATKAKSSIAYEKTLKLEDRIEKLETFLGVEMVDEPPTYKKKASK